MLILTTLPGKTPSEQEDATHDHTASRRRA
jgi:hypothetical protein